MPFMSERYARHAEPFCNLTVSKSELAVAQFFGILVIIRNLVGDHHIGTLAFDGLRNTGGEFLGQKRQAISNLLPLLLRRELEVH